MAEHVVVLDLGRLRRLRCRLRCVLGGHRWRAELIAGRMLGLICGRCGTAVCVFLPVTEVLVPAVDRLAAVAILTSALGPEQSTMSAMADVLAALRPIDVAPTAALVAVLAARMGEDPEPFLQRVALRWSRELGDAL